MFVGLINPTQRREFQTSVSSTLGYFRLIPERLDMEDMYRATLFLNRA